MFCKDEKRAQKNLAGFDLQGFLVEPFTKVSNMVNLSESRKPFSRLAFRNQ